jgi:hypothetical protein
MTRFPTPAADVLRLEETVSRVLTADILLPGQAPHSPVDHWLQRLCQALLADALKCLGDGSSHRHQAWEWVLSDAEYYFSFTTVCVVLQLNAEAVRQAVRHRCAPGRARPDSLSRLPRHITRQGRASA